ncbi:MAG: nicotinate-nucleotide diphosphorylase, partial [Psychrobacter sp.]
RNHRLGLDDAILIKDNHIAIAGDIKTAIQQAQKFAGHLIPIEVEVDTLEQLEQALDAGVSLVLLDNMSPETLSQAVAMCQGRAKTEASGGITPETVQAAANTGVDFIAMGYLTHSTTALDIGLDFSA